jgi:outer membrane receptor for ferrienterochelin and colicins
MFRFSHSVRERTFGPLALAETDAMNRLHMLLPLLPAMAFAAEPHQSPSGADPVVGMSLEELMQVPIESVQGASKYGQQVTQAPASVSVVTADDIRRFGYRTLAEILQSMRGVYVANDRNYSYIGMRGFMRPSDYNTRVLLLIDGHRINDNVYSSMYIDREGGLPTDLIERVELVRGPSSSIYGDNAFFGIVNIVTRHPAEGRGEVAVSAGNLETSDGRISYSTSLAEATRVDFTLAGYTSAGQRRIYYPEFDPAVTEDGSGRNGGVARNLDGEDAASMYAVMTHGEWKVTGVLSWREKEVPTASYATIFNDGALDTIDLRGYLDAKYDHRVDENTQLAVHAYYDAFRYTGHYPYDGASQGFDDLDRVVMHDEGFGDWVGTDLQLIRKLPGGHTLVGGVELRSNLRQHQLSIYESDPPVSSVISNEEGDIAAAFLQAEWRVTSKLLLNAGGRLDYYFDRFGATFNPRLAAIYSAREGTTLKALYGQAFRAPNVYEQYYDHGAPVRPNLSPERIRTYELAVEQYFQRTYRLGVSAFRYSITDLITQTADADDLVYFDNLDRATATGVELEVEAKYSNGVQAQVSHSVQKAKDDMTGEVLTNSPRILSNAGVFVPFLNERFSLGTQLAYHGSVRTLAGAKEDGFLLTNLTLTHRSRDNRTELSAGIYNLFDTEYAYPAAQEHVQDVIEQDGRTFRVKFTRGF